MNDGFTMRAVVRNFILEKLPQALEDLMLWNMKVVLSTIYKNQLTSAYLQLLRETASVGKYVLFRGFRCYILEGTDEIDITEDRERFENLHKDWIKGVLPLVVTSVPVVGVANIVCKYM